MVTNQAFGGSYKNKRVLVTGHTGFKGSWLCLLLHQLEADVYGYALEPPTDPSLFVEASISELMTSFIGDVRDYENLSRVLLDVGPEIVIHMAAQPLVRESYSNPVATYSTNVMGTVHLLEAVRNTPAVRAVVNVTTDKCYENREWHWGYRENDPMGGYDPYSSSKGCSELLTSAYRNSFFNSESHGSHKAALASARAGNVIGGGDWAEDRLVPDFFRAVSKGEQIWIRSPYAIRPWQHVMEPLDGYLTLASKLYSEGTDYASAWNFGPTDSDAKSVEWIIDRLCKLWEKGATYSIDSDPHPHEANYLKLDCSKANAELGWHPKWNIEKALESIVEWNKAFNHEEDIRQVTIRQINDYLRL